MNIRKNIDYGEMYAALDHAMASEMKQMDLYCAIGKAVSLRPEKGAAVAAAKYLTERYPDAHGFSPRNVRRMRDFYRTYEDHPALLTLALQIGWTQNVVILEADLSVELREWYLQAVKQFDWSKMELTENIADNVHEKIILAKKESVRDKMERESEQICFNKKTLVYSERRNMHFLEEYRWQNPNKERRRWNIIGIFLIRKIPLIQPRIIKKTLHLE